MVVGGKELFLYMHNKKDAREIDYGDEGQDYMGQDICSIQVALNTKFFMIGVPVKRAIGFFGLNRVQLSVQPLKWIIKYPFVDFFADDHMSTMMLLDSSRKTLDFHYVLWRFDTKGLDVAELKSLQNDFRGEGEEENDELGEEESMKSVAMSALETDHGAKGKAGAKKRKTCCTIF